MKTNFIVFLLTLLTLNAHGQVGFSRDTNIPVTGPNGQLTMPWAGGLNYPDFSEIDLNGDNIPDLFTFEKDNERVLTFINTGSGGLNCWRYAPQYADQFPELRSWAFLYDYNCDNKPDLFTCAFNHSGISQYRNDSQGSTILFTLVDSSMLYTTNGVQFSNISGSPAYHPAFNDIDGDGDMDIVVPIYGCTGGYAYFKNLSMDHTGACDSLNDFIVEHNIWGEFTLRSGLYENVAVGAWNTSCFVYAPPVLKEDPVYSYQIAQRDDTYSNIFTIDIDNDGDKDALIGDSGANNSLLVINGGTSAHAVMIPQGTDTLFPSYDVSIHEHTFAQHAYLDCDNDGVKDLLVSLCEWENNHGVQFYKNTGTTALPHFQFGTTGFLQSQMIDVGESATPVLFDVDADGLKDLIIGNNYRTTSDSTSETSLTLYRNNGTLTSPSFEFVTSDYAGLIARHLPGQIFPAFGDLDGDSDADMIVGLDNGNIAYFENIAGPGAPLSFAVPVYNYGSIDVGQACAPQLIDLNRDGYLDLVIGQKNGLIKYFENTQSFVNPFNAVATNDTLGGIRLHYPNSNEGYTVPFVFDQNGDYRMAVTYVEGKVYLYGNIDGNLSGHFTLLDSIVQFEAGVRFGYNLSVSGGDLNGDSLTDLVYGIYSGGVQIYYQDNLANTVNNVNDDKMISVIPNPASDKIIIKSKENGHCILMDISGRTVASCEIKGGYLVMNVSSFSEGIYFVHINSSGMVRTKRVVICR